MIYTDKIHIVADRLKELYSYCQEIGIKRCWFEGVKKKHPHYDIPKFKLEEVLNSNINILSSREILKISKKLTNISCQE